MKVAIIFLLFGVSFCTAKIKPIDFSHSKCVEDGACDVLGPKNECPSSICYNG